jgi:Flp pilus assembly protein TadB
MNASMKRDYIDSLFDVSVYSEILKKIRIESNFFKKELQVKHSLFSNKANDLESLKYKRYFYLLALLILIRLIIMYNIAIIALILGIVVLSFSIIFYFKNKNLINELNFYIDLENDRVRDDIKYLNKLNMRYLFFLI